MSYCIVGLALSSLFFTIYMSFFLSLHIFFVKDISTPIYDRTYIFGVQNNNDKLYHGIENRLCPIYSSLYVFTFPSLHAINTVIFRNRFLSNSSKLEGKYFVHVCILTTACCIVGLTTGFIKFIFFCIIMSLFLSLHIYRQKYLHNYIR